MGNHKRTYRLLICMLLTIALLVSIPASAANGTISIAYRGSGGYYIGDTIIFDGQNSFGNTTLIRLTGPGLPAEGVPIYDLNAAAGSANPVPGDTSGSWKFAWYTGTIWGIEKLQTARYYLTIYDSTYPDKTATTSVVLKKPEFYVVATPSVVGSGDYVQLTGSAEKGVTSVYFALADAQGTVVRSYESSVSSSGYFFKGFRADLPPGLYTITMSSPSVRTTYRGYLNVKDPKLPPESAPDAPGSPASPATPVLTGGTGSLSISSDPLGATVFIDSAMRGQTPLELDPVSAGTYLVEIKAPGYVTHTENVQVDADKNHAIRPVLVRSPASIPLSPGIVLSGLLISLLLLQFVVRRRTE
jgi:hypothetical protein